MNYEPNTIDWPVGALVIHDADAKSPHMLMRVTGRDKDGLYRTQYAYPDRHPTAWQRKIWRNDKRYLHDPTRFGIITPHQQTEKETST